MNVVEIQDTSVENMFVTMSSIGNVYVNTVIFSNCDISFQDFFNEEEIFYLLGGVGFFSYRCRRSKRKRNSNIYPNTSIEFFRQIFSLIHKAEWIDGFSENTSKDQIGSTKQSSITDNYQVQIKLYR